MVVHISGLGLQGLGASRSLRRFVLRARLGCGGERPWRGLRSGCSLGLSRGRLQMGRGKGRGSRRQRDANVFARYSPNFGAGGLSPRGASQQQPPAEEKKNFRTLNRQPPLAGAERAKKSVFGPCSSGPRGARVLLSASLPLLIGRIRTQPVQRELCGLTLLSPAPRLFYSQRLIDPARDRAYSQQENATHTAQLTNHNTSALSFPVYTGCLHSLCVETLGSQNGGSVKCHIRMGQRDRGGRREEEREGEIIKAWDRHGPLH